ncbi:MAG: hypothetical protein PF489_05335 [Salinivirgaceae bacterium]|nr:hypothetical protein [Salinivirgaceae bacterium]
MNVKIIASACLVFLGVLVNAQDPETELIKKYAETGFESGDYEFALENYKILYEKNKDDININFRLGVCYTQTNENKTGGIPHLEFVVSHNNFPVDAFYYLGQSYMYAYRFTEAVEAFYEYKISGLNNDLIGKADRMVTSCYTALQLMNVPIKVEYQRLDSTINTAMNDYSPFFDKANERLFYTSDVRYVEQLKLNVADIYFADRKNDVWLTANFWEFNSYENEEVAGGSSSNENLFIYSNGDFSSHDLSMARIKKRSLDRTKKDFPANIINTRDFEHGATMSSDGKKFYYSSDMPGGFGGMDIYYIEKDENDQWSEPKNAGAVINTESDDMFPNLSADGSSLYFSSAGHGGIGGFDLYEAIYSAQDEAWGITRSLGVPINTPYDEMSIAWEVEGRIGYISSNRKEGFGKLDVYRVIIDRDVETSYLIGTVMVGTPNASEPYSDAFNKLFVTLYDKYGNIYARYNIEGNQFYAAVPPGKYKLEIYLDGSDNKYEEDVMIIESGDMQQIEETYFVQP